MKTTHYSICAFWLALLLAGGIFRSVWSQQYVSQEGRMLDANPRVGSFGYNTPAPIDVVMPRANLYITGNIRGGRSFQGLVPYSSVDEFSGTLGSSALSNFYRDSTGSEDLSNSVLPDQPYIDPSRQVTRPFGQQIIQSTQLYQQTGVVPVGQGMRFSPSVDPLMNRPLSRTYSTLPYSREPSILDYDSRVPMGAAVPGQVGQPIVGLGEPFQAKTFKTQAPVQLDTPSSGLSDSPGMLPRQAGSEPVSALDGIEAAQPEMETGPGFYMRLQRQWQLEQQYASSGPGMGSSAEETSSFPASGEAVSQTDSADQESASSLPPSDLNTSSPNQLDSLILGRESTTQIQKRYFNFYINKGEDYLHRGKYYLAANAFEDALFYEPKNPVLYLAKSHALFGAGEYMSAAFFLDKALTLLPDLLKQSQDIKALFSEETLQKRREEIQTLYNYSVQPALLFLKGYIEFQMNDVDQARQSLTKAHELLPKQQTIRDLLEAVNAPQNPQKSATPPNK